MPRSTMGSVCCPPEASCCSASQRPSPKHHLALTACSQQSLRRNHRGGLKGGLCHSLSSGAWALLPLLLLALHATSASADASSADADAAALPVLPLGGVEINDTVLPDMTNILRVFPKRCGNKSFISFEIWHMHDVRNPSDFVPVLLVVNTGGQNPVVQPSGSMFYIANPGSNFSVKGFVGKKWYQWLSFNQSAYFPQEWRLGVYNDRFVSEDREVAYSLKAYCTEKPACPRNCSGHGVCRSDSTCSCEDGWGGLACGRPVKSLPADGSEIAQDIDSGKWHFYAFDIILPYTRALIEVQRQAGDLVLFAKEEFDGWQPRGLPTVVDYDNKSDTLAFRGRENYHHILWNSVEPSRAYAAVYNNEADFNDTGRYKISLRLATASEPLCPLNCSYPHGSCLLGPDAVQSSCSCEPDYSGFYCQGPLSIADPKPSARVKGWIPPGGWHYVQYTFDPKTNADLDIRFFRRGGQPVVVAKKEKPPTIVLQDYLLTNLVARDPLLTSFSLLDNLQIEGRFIIGIYNLDFVVHETSEFTLDFIVGKSSSSLVGSPAVIALFAVLPVVSLFTYLFIVRCVLLRFSRSFAANGGTDGDNVEMGMKASGIDRTMVETFPLLNYKDDLFPNQDDAQCSVCLLDYEKEDLLRKLPVCNHLFHVQCIDQWLEYHSTCPLCRTTLNQPQASNETSHPSQQHQEGRSQESPP